MAIYREDLEKIQPAAGEESDHVFFHAQCHPEAPVVIGYLRGTGRLLLTCGECRRIAGAIVVAKRNDKGKKVENGKKTKAHKTGNVAAKESATDNPAANVAVSSQHNQIPRFYN